jgi:hypothetical protein
MVAITIRLAGSDLRADPERWVAESASVDGCVLHMKECAKLFKDGRTGAWNTAGYVQNIEEMHIALAPHDRVQIGPI